MPDFANTARKHVHNSKAESQVPSYISYFLKVLQECLPLDVSVNVNEAS